MARSGSSEDSWFVRFSSLKRPRTTAICCQVLTSQVRGCRRGPRSSCDGHASRQAPTPSGRSARRVGKEISLVTARSFVEITTEVAPRLSQNLPGRSRRRPAVATRRGSARRGNDPMTGAPKAAGSRARELAQDSRVRHATISQYVFAWLHLATNTRLSSAGFRPGTRSVSNGNHLCRVSVCL